MKGRRRARNISEVGNYFALLNARAFGAARGSLHHEYLRALLITLIK